MPHGLCATTEPQVLLILRQPPFALHMLMRRGTFLKYYFPIPSFMFIARNRSGEHTKLC